MARHKGMSGTGSTWDLGLTPLMNHSCPWCQNTDLFQGHRGLRFCKNCTVTWGKSEEAVLAREMSSVEGFEETTMRQKVAALPSNMRKVANKGVTAIDEAMTPKTRLASLRAITNDEWQVAVDNSPEPEEI